MNTGRVLVCGSRDWTDREAVRSWMAKLQDYGYDTIIEGEARGADTIAKEEAKLIGLNVIGIEADWARYGRAAGPIRNSQMLNMSPDLVLAFHSNMVESKGTKDTVVKAERMRIPVIIEKGG